MYACFALILVVLSSQLNPQSEVTGPQPVEVSILELADHPDLYNNVRVRVRGELVTGFEHCTLDYYDPKTHELVASIWIDFEDDPSVAKEYRGKYNMYDFYKDVRSGRFTKG